MKLTIMPDGSRILEGSPSELAKFERETSTIVRVGPAPANPPLTNPLDWLTKVDPTQIVPLPYIGDPNSNLPPWTVTYGPGFGVTISATNQRFNHD